MNAANFLTIAYITALLKSLIEHGLVRDRVADLVGGVLVSALPPDQLGSGPDEHARINLFLSHVVPNTRVRSLNRPSKPEAPSPATPLALDLHYIVTAHGAKELQIETLLGYVSVLFREHSALAFLKGGWRVNAVGAGEPEMIDAPSVPGASERLPELIGSIGIRPQFPNADELSKIWSALQVKYRPSLSYTVEIQPERVGRPAGAAVRALEGVR